MALMVRTGQGKEGTGVYSFASTEGISEEFSGMADTNSACGFSQPVGSSLHHVSCVNLCLSPKKLV